MKGIVGNRMRAIDAAEAEDVQQKIWLRVSLNLHTFKGLSRFETWLISVTRNAINSFFVGRGHPQSASIDAEENEWLTDRLSADTYIQPDKIFELKRAVQRAVSSLNEQERHLILLGDIRKLTYKEIAVLVKMSPELVKSRLFQARKKFYALLGR